MPRFTPAELLPLLECEPSEISLRTEGLVGHRSPELAQRILDLRRRRAEVRPAPSNEELCLALLSLFALEGGGP